MLFCLSDALFQNIQIADDWNYHDLVEEIRTNGVNPSHAAVVEMYNLFTNEFGDYGSVNLGIRGQTYRAVTRNFLRIRNQQLSFGHTFPQMSAYIGEVELPALRTFKAAGPGGQGAAKCELNRALQFVLQRVYRMLGMIDFFSHMQKPSSDGSLP